MFLRRSWPRRGRVPAKPRRARDVLEKARSQGSHERGPGELSKPAESARRAKETSREPEESQEDQNKPVAADATRQTKETSREPEESQEN